MVKLWAAFFSLYPAIQMSCLLKNVLILRTRYTVYSDVFCEYHLLCIYSIYLMYTVYCVYVFCMCLLLVAVQTCGQQLSRGLAFTELRAPSPGGAGAADKEISAV